MADITNQFNASVLNNAVFNYGDKKISKYIGVMPVIPEVFIGRDEDIRGVHDRLFYGNNMLLLVNGEGGIGKTTLAAKYFERYIDDYTHLAWVFAERNLRDALLTLAEPLKITFDQTLSDEERLEKMLLEMAGLKKPCLLVIDNANDLPDLTTHYHELRKCPNFHILLTTRITEFSHARTYRVGHLDEPTAMELFSTHYPGHNPAEDDLLKGILRAIGYNTLVIELLAKSLRSVNRFRTGYSLEQMLGDLQHSGLFGLSRSETVLMGYNPGSFEFKEEKPEKIIAAMYDLAQLEQGEEQLLCIFSVLPAEPVAFAALEELQPGNKELERWLGSLVQKGWIEYDSTTNNFKCSPVVQAVSRRQVGERLYEQCELLVDTLVEKLDYDTGTGHWQNTDYKRASLYVRYAENIIGFIDNTHYEKVILLDRVGNFHNTIGNLDKALTFFEERSRLGKELYEAYPQNVSFKYGLAISYSKLGSTHSALGNLDKALTFFEKDTQLTEELYEAYPQNVSFKYGLAISYAKLGIFSRDHRNDMEAACSWFAQAEALWAELVNRFPAYAEFQKNWAEVKSVLDAL